MNVKIEESWRNELAEEWEQPYFKQLVNFVHDEYSHYQIFPPGREIFAAFDATPFDKVKVVILGLLGTRRCAVPAVTCQHFQGNPR